jgi:hypothetical protein
MLCNVNTLLLTSREVYAYIKEKVTDLVGKLGHLGLKNEWVIESN